MIIASAFNQEKALVGAFSVIVKTGCGTDGSVYSTSLQCAVVTTIFRTHCSLLNQKPFGKTFLKFCIIVSSREKKNRTQELLLQHSAKLISMFSQRGED